MKNSQDIWAMQAKIAEYEAALRTLSNFGGTLQQARDLASKVLGKCSQKESCKKIVRNTSGKMEVGLESVLKAVESSSDIERE